MMRTRAVALMGVSITWTAVALPPEPARAGAALWSTRAGTIIHVDDDNCPGPGDGSELNPYCSIQTAINNAVDTDEIVVAPGTYFEAIDFIGKAITVRSTDPTNPAIVAATIIDGQGRQVVNITSGEGPDTVLSGLAIINGTGILGGGLEVIASSPIVTRCIFSGNSAVVGGGLHIRGSTGVTVSRCRFEGNTASSIGGGMHVSNTRGLVVEECVFVGNTSDGASGGGLYLQQGIATVARCRFEMNTAGTHGGGFFSGAFGDNADVTLIACEFTLNEAGKSGGGAFNAGFTNRSVQTFVNCTFTGNTAVTGSGGAIAGGELFDRFAEVVIVARNCVLFGNLPDEISSLPETVVVSYSDIQGGFAGPGNIDADPMFVDPDNGDFRLSPGSPGIDAGNNWGVPRDSADVDADGNTTELTPWDLDGNPRFAGDGTDFDPGCGEPVVVDMGAYERPGASFEVVFGDLNGNGAVGVADLMILVECLGSDDPECCIADLNLDGVIGFADRLLMAWAMVEFVPVALGP